MVHPTQRHAHPLARPLFVPFALAALLACALPAYAQQARLTHADAPARLIRKTTVYDAPAGTSLSPGDLVITGATGAQLEWPAGVTVRLGPGSGIVVDEAAAAPAVTVLRGWVKVAAAGRLNVAAGAVDVGAAAGSGIVHVDGDRTELFVEQGAMTATVTEQAGAGAPLTVGREQYALYLPAQGLQASPRAPRPFVAAMPPGFFDPLVAVGARVKPAEPVQLRDANPSDVAFWNDAAVPVRKQLAVRFAPRLLDPAFRAGAATVLANQPEWRQPVRDSAPARKPSNTLSNTLF
jgi:hypothetical protein